jgi:hypothetical protein
MHYFRHMPFDIEVSTAADTADSVETAFSFLRLAKNDHRYWKWFVFAVHATIQNTFTLLLENGNGYLVQKTETMKKMLKADASGGQPVKQSMDYFMELYSKVLRKENLRSDTVPPPDERHREALFSMNEIRNDFAHFNAKTWYIESHLLTQRAATSLDIVTFFLAQPQSILWHDAHLKHRVVVGVNTLSMALNEC